MVFLCLLSLVTLPHPYLETGDSVGKKIHLSIEEICGSLSLILAQKIPEEGEMATPLQYSMYSVYSKYSKYSVTCNPWTEELTMTTVHMGGHKSRTRAHIAIPTYSCFLILPLSLSKYLLL